MCNWSLTIKENNMCEHRIDFQKNAGLVPAIVQNSETGEVLMLAYMNKESLLETIQTKRAVYFSRSRKCIWRKGETSGHIQHVREIFYDCDSDTILLKVRQVGAACHTGRHSCFFRRIEGSNITLT